MREADVHFYIDADVLGLGKVLGGLRSDITYAGDPGATIHKRVRPACPISDLSTPDSVWIPEVTRRGWLIITRDNAIQQHRAEIAAVLQHGARMVALAGPEATNTWAQLEVIFSRWRNIENLLEEQGPFIYAATRTSLKRVSLDAP